MASENETYLTLVSVLCLFIEFIRFSSSIQTTEIQYAGDAYFFLDSIPSEPAYMRRLCIRILYCALHFFSSKLLMPLFVSILCYFALRCQCFRFVASQKKDQRFPLHSLSHTCTHSHTRRRWSILNQVWNCSHVRIKIWMKHCTDKRISCLILWI